MLPGISYYYHQIHGDDIGTCIILVKHLAIVTEKCKACIILTFI